ncbi:MAG: hypothetical protein ACOYOL_12465 [Chthoniobacterales bacterium]
MHTSRARAIKEALEKGLVVGLVGHIVGQEGVLRRGEFTLDSDGVDRVAEVVIRILQEHGFMVTDGEGTACSPVPEYTLTFTDAMDYLRSGYGRVIESEGGYKYTIMGSILKRHRGQQNWHEFPFSVGDFTQKYREVNNA